MACWTKGQWAESGNLRGQIEEITDRGTVVLKSPKSRGTWEVDVGTLRRIDSVADTQGTVVLGLQPDPPATLNRLKAATGHPVLPSPVAPPTTILDTEE